MPATYEPIATTTLSALATTITLSSIPGTYTDLRIVFNGRMNAGGGEKLYIRPNNSATAIYSQTFSVGTGTSIASFRTSNESYWTHSNNDPISSTVPNLVIIDIFNYASTSINKSAIISGSADENGAGFTSIASSLWRSTSAITSIRFLGSLGNNFAIGTTVTIYGILRA
jgi:hypothetical protein